MVPAQLQSNQEVTPIEDVVLLVLAGESKDGQLPFYHPGQFNGRSR